MNLENGFREKDIEETYECLNNILEKAGIEVTIDVEQKLEHVYSSRVKLRNIPLLGTNGKGISEKASLVSGMAEFLERLQTFSLYKFKLPISCLSSKYDFCYSPDEELHEDNNGDFLNHNILLSKKEIENRKILHIPFREIFGNRVVFMPARTIDLCYATNGMASGNQYTECYLQALCEIFERYANLTVLKKQEALPTIPSDVIFNSDIRIAQIYKEILSISDCKIIFKDASLGKHLPVIMMIFIDKSIGKYFVKFASHPILQVAALRLLTELLQGRRLVARGVWLQSFSLDEIENEKYNFNNIIRSGDGQYPWHIFKETNSKPDLDVWIKNKNVNNSKMIAFIKDILLKNGWTAYTRNIGYLGFPTCHIIIPGVSEVYDRKVIDSESNFMAMRELYKKAGKLSKKEGLLLANFVIKSVKPEQSLNDFFGLLLKDTWRYKEEASIFFVIAMLLRNDERKRTLIEIEKYKRKDKNLLICRMIKQWIQLEAIGECPGKVFDAIYKKEYIDKAKMLIYEPEKYLYAVTDFREMTYDSEVNQLHNKLQKYYFESGVKYE